MKKNKISTGYNFWLETKKIIPTGAMLKSKYPDRYLPNLWPSYFKKAKDIKIWDLDNNFFYDYSTMGIGTNILGYSNPIINKFVFKAIEDGNLTTLNSPYEKILAEKLISLHPWSQSVQFAKTGAEAAAIAIRIARMCVDSKKKIAICGYHGWQDWYLALNINNKNNLDSFLSSNTPADGIPRSLGNQVFSFEYNNFDKFKKVIDEKNIGIVIMEVERNQKPTKNFLHKIRNYCDKKSIILIFDECTSGFREVFGGLHLKYKVNPDIAIFGKALGNSHPITAIIGKKEIMSNADKSFISSTFWTEKSGYAAAIKTLDLMEKYRSWEVITEIGNKMQSGWKAILNRHGLKYEISGIPSLLNFRIESKNWQIIKSFITKEMLEKKILFSNQFYSCILHEKKISYYLDMLDESIYKLKKFDYNNSEIRPSSPGYRNF